MFLLKKKKINPKKIIISRTDKIGDLVLSIPSFVTVKKMFPNALLYVLVRKYNEPVIKHLDFIDEVIPIDDYSKSDLKNKIKSIHADTFIALFSNNYVLRLALISGAKYRIGPLSKPLSWFVYNYGIKQKRSCSIKNEAEYNLDLIKQLDHEKFNETGIHFSKIKYLENNNIFINNFLNDNNITDKFILIHPFSGGSTKNFTLDEYKTLIKKLIQKDNNLNIIISSSTEDYNNAVTFKKDIDYNKIYIFKNNSNLLNLVSLIDKCSVFIGASTGPTHIAGNLCKNAVGIYPVKKTLSTTRWGMYGNKNADYIIPDENIEDKDYSLKTFENIDNNIIEKTAELIMDKLKND